MLYNKYIMMGALCASGLMLGADVDSRRALVERGRLEFADCFDCKEALVSGPERFYAPVLIANISEVGLFKRLFQVGTPLSASKLMRGLIGFVEGSDPELIKEVAKNIEQRIRPFLLHENENSLWILALKKGILKQRLFERVLQETVGDDFERYKKLKGTTFLLQALMQSSDKESRPKAMRVVTDNKVPYFETEEIEDLVFSPKRQEYIESSRCFLSKATVDQRLSVIGRSSMSPLASHPAPFLVLNEERCAKFLEQKFGEETN